MKNLNNYKYQPPINWLNIKTIDLHTGGEPLRVLYDGIPEIKGNNILEKRRYFQENWDHIRTGTMFEPRGHADMYGAFITEPITEMPTLELSSSITKAILPCVDMPSLL